MLAFAAKGSVRVVMTNEEAPPCNYRTRGGVVAMSLLEEGGMEGRRTEG